MAFHTRLHVYNTVLEAGLMPLFFNPDIDTSRNVIDALRAGGAPAVEFTNRGDFAIEVFSALRKHYGKDLILGVGSVFDAPTAALYIAHGADFIVGPTLNPDVARLCNRHKIAYMPGCGTLSEISQAEELGAEIVKIFPAPAVGGPGFVKAILGPSPWTRIMPTGGVSAEEDNLRAWFAAGVACVGMGSKLVAKDDIAAGNFAAITQQTEQVLAWIKGFRDG